MTIYHIFLLAYFRRSWGEENGVNVLWKGMEEIL